MEPIAHDPSVADAPSSSPYGLRGYDKQASGSVAFGWLDPSLPLAD